MERESQEAIDQFTPPVAGGMYDMPQAPVDTSRFQSMLGSGSPIVKQVNSPIQFNSPRSKPLRAYKSSL